MLAQVHLDEEYFPQPKAFCPMRMLNGNIERMSAEFELVTFGHGQKRCIGEKVMCTARSNMHPVHVYKCASG